MKGGGEGEREKEDGEQTHSASPLQQGPQKPNNILRLSPLNDIMWRRNELQTVQWKLPEITQSAKLSRKIYDLVITQVKRIERRHLANALRDPHQLVM